jgi:hypothetical protein
MVDDQGNSVSELAQLGVWTACSPNKALEPTLVNVELFLAVFLTEEAMMRDGNAASACQAGTADRSRAPGQS